MAPPIKMDSHASGYEFQAAEDEIDMEGAGSSPQINSDSMNDRFVEKATESPPFNSVDLSGGVSGTKSAGKAPPCIISEALLVAIDKVHAPRPIQKNQISTQRVGLVDSLPPMSHLFQAAEAARRQLLVSSNDAPGSFPNSSDPYISYRNALLSNAEQYKNFNTLSTNINNGFDSVNANGQHVCPVTKCGKAFPTKSRLNRHLIVHTGDKPFACLHPGCNKAFSRRDNMMQHYKSHEKTATNASSVSEQFDLLTKSQASDTASEDKMTGDEQQQLP